MIAPLLAIARGVPVWVWALVACVAWGGFNFHRAKTQTAARAAAEQAAAVQATAAIEQAKAREVEHKLNTAAQEAADAYRSTLAQAQRSAAVARTERDRLLDGIASAPGGCPAGPSAAATSGADGAAASRVVVRECSAALQEVAAAADTSDARVIGLQSYIRTVLAECRPTNSIPGSPGSPASAPTTR